LVKNDLKKLKEDSLDECRKEIYPELKRITKERFNVELGEPLREYYGMGNTTIAHRPYSDNLLITGEAMGMVQPIYFYGFETSLVYGKLAGKAAAEAVKLGRYDQKALKGYAKAISENEVCGYAWGNIARECLIAGSAVIGEDIMKIVPILLRELGKSDVDFAYDIIAQRKLSLSKGVLLSYVTLKETAKAFIKTFKNASVSELINAGVNYISDRF